MTLPRTIAYLLILVCISSAFAADVPLGSSDRGERLFETQRCTRCHSVNGRGGATAPDLGRRIGRNHSPALLAGTLWNHAPTMWSQMQQRGIAAPSMSTQDAADLFAYFYSTRFFDKPGDAARGKNTFTRNHCADCHGLAEQKTGAAPAVANWRSLTNPVALAEAMWNHAEGMRNEFARRGFHWPQLTAQELTDIFVYLGNHPSMRRQQPSFEFASEQGGEALMKEKGCLECHRGDLALAPRLRGKTINDIAVSMWNHAPRMTQRAGRFEPGEMSTLLAYMWSQEFFAGGGDSGRGKKVFREKSCAGCHEEGQAPRLAGAFTAMRMTSALWNHGPTMLQHMNNRGISWPTFNSRDMADLIAWLNSAR
jgi:mono/diheme cytochrome c family protein